MSLQRGLQRLEGVDQAKLILKPPHMEVKLKPGAWVDPARMTANIRRAGYTPILTDVRLTVTGRVEKRGDTLVVALDQMKTPVELTAVPHGSSPQTAPHLAHHVGQVMQVEGYWQPKQPKALAVTAVKVEGGTEDKHPEEGVGRQESGITAM